MLRVFSWFCYAVAFPIGLALGAAMLAIGAVLFLLHVLALAISVSAIIVARASLWFRRVTLAALQGIRTFATQLTDRQK